MRRIREESQGESPVQYIHPEWRSEYPWLIQGITGATDGFDLRLFGPAPAGSVLERWDRLREVTGCDRAVHARQVHGSTVATHSAAGGAGLEVGDATDGHVTKDAAVLLTVAVADCVPLLLFDPEERVVGSLHAGWRGVVAGVLSTGIRAMEALGAKAERIRLHMGPHICGSCYEVGPEVHEALGFDPPSTPQPVSLAQALADRASRLGIAQDSTTVSMWCTRCDSDRLYSHRAGAVGRQVGFIATRPS